MRNPSVDQLGYRSKQYFHTFLCVHTKEGTWQWLCCVICREIILLNNWNTICSYIAKTAVQVHFSQSDAGTWKCTTYSHNTHRVNICTYEQICTCLYLIHNIQWIWNKKYELWVVMCAVHVTKSTHTYLRQMRVRNCFSW